LTEGHLRMTSNGVCIVGFSSAVHHHCGHHCSELITLVSLEHKRSLQTHARQHPDYAYHV
jgi:hypothetical protein